MNISKFLYRLVIIFLVATLLISGSFVVRYIFDGLQQKSEYDALAAQVAAARQEAARQTDSVVPDTPGIPAPTSGAVTDPEQLNTGTESAEPGMLPEYAALYEENTDLVGWMTIEGTPIDYPVMQTPDRVDYYLHRNFKKESNSHGCLYVRETCDVFEPSDNVTIYGHHMKDGSMFASLKKFRKQEFWEEYHTIDFDTLYERHSYTIFAVFTTTASVGEGFTYHRFEYAADEAEFDQFVSTCKALSLYDTGITPRYGDKLICLSTCEYSQENGRLVVVAVRD